MLKLKSTARLKRRYLLVKGEKSAIEQAILEYVGVLGWAKAAPVFLPHAQGMLVFAVNREEIVNIRAALALSPHSIQVVRVSGTLHGLQKEKHKT